MQNDAALVSNTQILGLASRDPVAELAVVGASGRNSVFVGVYVIVAIVVKPKDPVTPNCGLVQNFAFIDMIRAKLAVLIWKLSHIDAVIVSVIAAVVVDCDFHAGDT